MLKFSKIKNKNSKSKIFVKENRNSIDASVEEGVKCKHKNLLQKQMYTSVACAICPSVNKLRAQLIFPSKPNFCNFFWIFNNKIYSKINIFHTLALQNVK